MRLLVSLLVWLLRATLVTRGSLVLENLAPLRTSCGQSPASVRARHWAERCCEATGSVHPRNESADGRR